MRFNKFIGVFLLMTAFNFTHFPAQAQSYSASYKFLKAIKDVNYRDIKVAIEKGVNINTRDYDDKSTALIMAVRMKELPLARYLLGNRAKTDLVGDDGKTPLLIAAAGGNRAMVALLIKAGADLDLADNNGTTPLVAGVLASKGQIVTLLLEAGADHTLEDYSGRSPLQHAIDNRQRRIEKLLREAGATR